MNINIRLSDCIKAGFGLAIGYFLAKDIRYTIASIMMSSDGEKTDNITTED